MYREVGNEEKMRKCSEWISLHFLILSPCPLQSPRLQQVAQPCIKPNWTNNCASSLAKNELLWQMLSNLLLPKSQRLSAGKELWHLLSRMARPKAKQTQAFFFIGDFPCQSWIATMPHITKLVFSTNRDCFSSAAETEVWSTISFVWFGRGQEIHVATW